MDAASVEQGGRPGGPGRPERPECRVTVAITTGEPAGVGPELTLAALAEGGRDGRWGATRFVVLGDVALLRARAAAIGLDWTTLSARAEFAVEGPSVTAPVQAGVLDPRNGLYVLQLLDRAIDGALADRFDAIVTAPLQKSTINDAGVPFTGHTEYLAERTRTDRVVMMLAGPVAQMRRDPRHAHQVAEPSTGETGVSGVSGVARPYMFRVALATTHLPLAQVPAALDIPMLVETLQIVHRDLQRDFALPTPRILVTGLNPHAGESGYLGREEIDIIAPALAHARQLGIDAQGPYPADTLFQPRYLADADCVLAMYHDQGLPVLKYATFGEGINVTLGLPIVRVSVDHGTALDLAGTGRADAGSMLSAIDTAVAMAHNRRSRPAQRI